MSGKEELRERLGNLFGEINNYDGRPSASQIERLEGLGIELEERQTEFELETAEIDGLNRILAKRGLEPLVLLTREAWLENQDGTGGTTVGSTMAALGLLLGL